MLALSNGLTILFVLFLSQERLHQPHAFVFAKQSVYSLSHFLFTAGGGLIFLGRL
jgi:hypothetical protein